MALRNRQLGGLTVNQENVKNVKSMSAAAQVRRAALGEIGNRVIATKTSELTGKTNQVTKDKVLVKKPHIAKSIAVKVDKLEKVDKADSKPVALKQQQQQQHQVPKPAEKPEAVLEKHQPQQQLQVVLEAIKPQEVEAHVNKRVQQQLQQLQQECNKANDSFSTNLIEFEDIDEEDHKNPILVSVYSNDIYAHLRNLEVKYPVQRGYLAGQEITPKMRCVLVDWLIEVHEQFHLMQETLYLTIAIIDRFLQEFRQINRKRLQLVGVTAMFIASKYEEMYSPDISDFVYITDNAYTKQEILQMEMLIIKHLHFSFGRPLPLHFLRRYSKAGKSLPIHHTLAKYFLEQCLVHYEVCHHPPSLIAAAAIYLSFLLLGNDLMEEGEVIWTKTLEHYSTYRARDILPVVQEISAIIVQSEKSKYQAVRRKYTNSKHMKISLRPELKSPILVSLANHHKHD